jgi:hypothetical protein
VIGIELEAIAVLLLFAQAEVLVDRGAAVGAVQPFGARAPFEAGGLRGLGQGFTGAQQGLDVDAVVGIGWFGIGLLSLHLAVSSSGGGKVNPALAGLGQQCAGRVRASVEAIMVFSGGAAGKRVFRGWPEIPRSFPR